MMLTCQNVCNECLFFSVLTFPPFFTRSSEYKQKMDPDIETLNKQLDKLKQGRVTELSDAEELPNRRDYLREPAKRQLRHYLIPDLVEIVRQYMDWVHLDHIPLFSVPRHKFLHRRDNIVFFGRTDGKPFRLWLNESEYVAKAHFPLLLRLVTNNLQLVDDSDHDIKYLIGYCTNNKLYPKLGNVDFTWQHGIIGKASQRIKIYPSDFFPYLSIMNGEIRLEKGNPKIFRYRHGLGALAYAS